MQFIVMFRARFGDVFPKSLPHYGPQDVERGVSDPAPGDHIERLLCALVGLVLNRKKDVEYDLPSAAAYSFPKFQTHAIAPLQNLLARIRINRNINLRKAHYQRPLEEAIQTHASQWPRSWEGKNPLSGGQSFATMTPDERVCRLFP